MSAERNRASRPADGARGKRAAGKSRPKGGRSAAKRPKSLPRRILRWALLGFLGLFLLGGAAFAYGYVSTDIPDPNKAFQAQTSYVYYADGKTEIGRFAIQNRESIPLSEVPQYVQDAVIAAENQSFWTDQGIDPKGILRAAFSNAQGNATQGASTITQQYVKVLYLSQDQTLTRKIKEAFLSLKIQRQVSKSEILQGYLNTIYFGRGAYGIQAAAQAYFDKDAKDLNVGEGAVLASVLNSPGNLDPAEGKDARRQLRLRYEYVLDGMAEMGTLPTGRAGKAARRLPDFPEVAADATLGGQRGYMMEMVKAELIREGFTDAQIQAGGLRITTTFTRAAMAAATSGVADNRPPGLKQLHIAVATVDPATGGLRGFYAGQDYLKSNGGTNWALTGGAPGSAFKPFAVAAGIEGGYSLDSTFQGDSPYEFPNGDTVVNEGPGDGNDYGSEISLLTATEQSVNTAFVDLTMSLENGPEKIKTTAIEMGIPKDTEGLNADSVISLGSATINPIDMANSYGTIDNGGLAKDWYVVAKVADAEGKSEYSAPETTQRVLEDPVARDVSFALQGVVKNGTGQNALALGRPAAGKTGTATNADGDVSSSWFVGYTPQLVTAVMYVRGDGNDALDGYMPSYFGADYPTRTWTSVMDRSLGAAPIEQFPPRGNVKAKAKDGQPTPSYTPEPTPTPQPTQPPPSRTPRPTPSQTPSETPTPTQTPSETESSSPTTTPSITISPPGSSSPPADPG